MLTITAASTATKADCPAKLPHRIGL
jgi:hypothetical protein